MGVCCIDIEASSIEPGGFPIAVAWSLPSGAVCSAVIKPPVAWREVGVWDPIAEELHGLSAAELAAIGMSPWVMARRLNEALVGQWVYCDALVYDRAWRDQIFEAAGVDPQFQLADAMRLIAERLGEPASAGAHWYEMLREAAMRRRPELQAHRAEDDVRLLQEILALAQYGGDDERRMMMRRK